MCLLVYLHAMFTSVVQSGVPYPIFQGYRPHSVLSPRYPNANPCYRACPHLWPKCLFSAFARYTKRDTQHMHTSKMSWPPHTLSPLALTVLSRTLVLSGLWTGCSVGSASLTAAPAVLILATSWVGTQNRESSLGSPFSKNFTLHKSLCEPEIWFALGVHASQNFVLQFSGNSNDQHYVYLNNHTICTSKCGH